MQSTLSHSRLTSHPFGLGGGAFLKSPLLLMRLNCKPRTPASPPRGRGGRRGGSPRRRAMAAAHTRQHRLPSSKAQGPANTQGLRLGAVSAKPRPCLFTYFRTHACGQPPAELRLPSDAALSVPPRGAQRDPRGNGPWRKERSFLSHVCFEDLTRFQTENDLTPPHAFCPWSLQVPAHR